MLTISQALVMVAVIAAVTFLTRLLPFIIFPENKQIPH